MANQLEGPISLQTDQVQQVPNPVRTILATLIVNGVPQTVSMQVVSIADGNGNVIDDFADYNWKKAVLFELRELRKLMSTQIGAFQPIQEDVSLTVDAGR